MSAHAFFFVNDTIVAATDSRMIGESPDGTENVQDGLSKMIAYDDGTVITFTTGGAVDPVHASLLFGWFARFSLGEGGPEEKAERIHARLRDEGIDGVVINIAGFDEQGMRFCKVCRQSAERKDGVEKYPPLDEHSVVMGLDWIPPLFDGTIYRQAGSQMVMYGKSGIRLSTLTRSELLDLAVFVLQAGAKHSSFCRTQDGSRLRQKVGGPIDIVSVSRTGDQLSGPVRYRIGANMGLDQGAYDILAANRV